MSGSLNATQILLWTFWLGTTVPPDFENVLSEDEIARVRRFRREIDRRRWIIGRYKLRHVLAGETGQSVAEVCFGYGVSGKPYLLNQGQTRLEFNLTHAGNLLAIAVSEPAVGVDTEPVRELSGLEAIVLESLSERESNEVLACDLTDRPRHFLEYWTSKEAILKASGTGLSGLQQLDLHSSNYAHEGARVWRNQGVGACHAVPLELPDGYVGAAAVMGEHERVEVVYR